MFFSLFVAYSEFPKLENAIFQSEKQENINIETSGNLGMVVDEKCVNTYGNETLFGNEMYDWRSNIVDKASSKKDKPFIQYSIKGKKMRLKQYSVRNGCCYYTSSCKVNSEEKTPTKSYCCTELYSYSLRASNNKVIWETLHKVEEDKYFYLCQTKTFDIQRNSQSYKYFRFVLDEEYPKRPICLQLNQIEFYGKVFDENEIEDEDEDNDEESISIIGRLKRN